MRFERFGDALPVRQALRHPRARLDAAQRSIEALRGLTAYLGQRRRIDELTHRDGVEGLHVDVVTAW